MPRGQIVRRPPHPCSTHQACAVHFVAGRQKRAVRVSVILALKFNVGFELISGARYVLGGGRGPEVGGGLVQLEAPFRVSFNAMT